MNNAKLFSDEAANIYERAISTLLKKNMLLYFAYADYEEVSKNSDVLTLKPKDISHQ